MPKITKLDAQHAADRLFNEVEHWISNLIHGPQGDIRLYDFKQDHKIITKFLKQLNKENKDD